MAENLPQGTALVAQGQISKNRKGVFGTIFEEIFVNNFNEMKKTFIQDVIVPNTKDWMYGLLSSMLDDMFFKTSGSGSYRSSSIFSRSRTDYSSRFRGSSRESSRRDRREDSRREDIRDWEEISFNTRADAEQIVSSMKAAVHDYGIVTIADLFSFSGLESSWADCKYGWASLDNAKAFRGRDGRFYLDLPSPMAIDDD